MMFNNKDAGIVADNALRIYKDNGSKTVTVVNLRRLLEGVNNVRIPKTNLSSKVLPTIEAICELFARVSVAVHINRHFLVAEVEGNMVALVCLDDAVGDDKETHAFLNEMNKDGGLSKAVSVVKPEPYNPSQAVDVLVCADQEKGSYIGLGSKSLRIITPMDFRHILDERIAHYTITPAAWTAPNILQVLNCLHNALVEQNA